MTTTEQLCGKDLHPAGDRTSKGECRPCSYASRAVRTESRVERLKRLLREAEPPEPNWQMSGLCADADPTDWFPADGAGVAIEEVNRARHERAKKVCLMCPVRKSCLDWALLSGGEPVGTWGSELFTSTDRDPMRQARKELASE